MAEISGGEYFLPRDSTQASPFCASATVYGTRLLSDDTSPNLRPMNRLMEKIVFSELVTACHFATWPTRRSPPFVNATSDGVSRAPSWLTTTVGWPASMTATTELVVPRSIPMTFPGIG